MNPVYDQFEERVSVWLRIPGAKVHILDTMMKIDRGNGTFRFSWREFRLSFRLPQCFVPLMTSLERHEHYEALKGERVNAMIRERDELRQEVERGKAQLFDMSRSCDSLRADVELLQKTIDGEQREMKVVRERAQGWENEYNLLLGRESEQRRRADALESKLQGVEAKAERDVASLQKDYAELKEDAGKVCEQRDLLQAQAGQAQLERDRARAERDTAVRNLEAARNVRRQELDAAGLEGMRKRIEELEDLSVDRANHVKHSDQVTKERDAALAEVAQLKIELEKVRAEKLSNYAEQDAKSTVEMFGRREKMSEPERCAKPFAFYYEIWCAALDKLPGISMVKPARVAMRRYGSDGSPLPKEGAAPPGDVLYEARWDDVALFGEGPDEEKAIADLGENVVEFLRTAAGPFEEGRVSREMGRRFRVVMHHVLNTPMPPERG